MNAPAEHGRAPRRVKSRIFPAFPFVRRCSSADISLLVRIVIFASGCLRRQIRNTAAPPIFPLYFAPVMTAVIR
jgi:hypothetical protein